MSESRYFTDTNGVIIEDHSGPRPVDLRPVVGDVIDWELATALRTGLYAAATYLTIGEDGAPWSAEKVQVVYADGRGGVAWGGETGGDERDEQHYRASH